MKKSSQQKVFVFGGVEKGYTPVLNFYECVTEFESKPLALVELKCLFCQVALNAKLGRVSNLNRHLKEHFEYRNWLALYNKSNTKCKVKNNLDSRMLNLVQYFISSNSALTELKNKFLINLLNDAKIKLSNYYAFKNNLLPDVLEMMNQNITSKLESSLAISLIGDLWTNHKLADFVAVAVRCTYKSQETECFILDINEMVGKHSAENVKTAIEKNVNKFEFNKKKIIGEFKFRKILESKEF